MAAHAVPLSARAQRTAALRPCSSRSCAVVCRAKTTSSRQQQQQQASSSSGRTTSSSRTASQGDAVRKAAGGLDGVRQRLSSIVHYLTPKQEGDVGDVLMISISLAVFVWLAMQMYRLYYFTYLQMGVLDMMS